MTALSPPAYRFHSFAIGAFLAGELIYVEITNTDVASRNPARVPIGPRSDFRPARSKPSTGDGIAPQVPIHAARRSRSPCTCQHPQAGD
jgi:hypothetical protein